MNRKKVEQGMPLFLNAMNLEIINLFNVTKIQIRGVGVWIQSQGLILKVRHFKADLIPTRRKISIYDRESYYDLFS